MDKIFITKREIIQNIGDRKVVFFGAGNICEKTIREFSNYKNQNSLILDNAKLSQNTKQNGLAVYNPEFIKNKKKDYFVIITSTSFNEINDQLKSLGFLPSLDFCVSPVLKDLKIIQDLEQNEFEILFSSGAPKKNEILEGGGIYKINYKKGEWELSKLFSGHSYGMIKQDETLILIDSNEGVIRLDSNFNIIQKGNIPKGYRGHGIAFSPEKNTYYVVCSMRDSILELDENFKIKDEIFISEKFKRTGTPHHHLNDCYIKGESLYVSMFSYSGNWKEEIFDGCILEVNINEKKNFIPVVSNLWMPHNVKSFSNNLTYLESLPGYLKSSNNRIIGQFPAFTRGLDYDYDFFYIGQSRNRNHSKNIGINHNTSIDSGVIVFDPVSKLSKFVQVSHKITEIHSILKI